MGVGYCPVTDLLWTIKEKLGKGRPQCNFINYWLSKISDISWDPEHGDNAIVGVTVLTCMIPLFLNVRDYLW